jgi:hypothetical protein
MTRSPTGQIALFHFTLLFLCLLWYPLSTGANFTRQVTTRFNS